VAHDRRLRLVLHAQRQGRQRPHRPVRQGQGQGPAPPAAAEGRREVRRALDRRRRRAGTRIAAIAADVYDYAFSQSLTGKSMWSLFAAASEGDGSADARGLALGSAGTQWTLTDAEHLDDPKETRIFRVVGACARSERITAPSSGDYAATDLAVDGETLYLLVPGVGVVTHVFTPSPTPTC
jgi:hypothetical protein